MSKYGRLSENDALVGLAIAEHIECRTPYSPRMTYEQTERDHIERVLGSNNVQAQALARYKAQQQKAKPFWKIW